MTTQTSSSNSRYSLRNRNSEGQFDSQLSIPDSSSPPPAPLAIASKKKSSKKPAKTAPLDSDDVAIPSQLVDVSTPTEEAIPKKPEPQPITGKRKRRGAFSASEGNVSSEKQSEKDPAAADEVAFTERPGVFSRMALRSFLEEHITEPHCHQCHQNLSLDKLLDGHLQHWSSAHRRHTDISPSGISCPTFECNATTCLGCGKQPAKGDGSKALELPICCEIGWYTSLWLFLSYFDSQNAQAKGGVKIKEEEEPGGTSSKSKKPKPKKSRGWNNPNPPKGTGYNDGHHYNDQYNDYDPDEMPENSGSSHLSEARKQDLRTKADRREAALLVNIAQLMTQMPEDAEITSSSSQASPKRSRKGRNNTAKPSKGKTGVMLVRSMFCWSGVLNDILELFHNDSVEEAFKRVELYTAALDLVSALLQSDETATLVKDRTYDAFRAIDANASVKVCPSLTFQVSPGKVVEDYDGPSIAHSIENLVAAARALQDTASSMPHIYSDKASKELLDFCARIKSVGEQLSTTNEEDTTAGALAQIRRSSQDARARLEMVDEGVITKMYRMNTKMNFKTAPAHKRMRSLFYELSILRTSLPEGIHAKVAISRPDVIKVLIIGPQDTPYQGGLFEFDILCPENYPQQPPMVECATAGRDEARTIHLNPNLYSSGYVCLSLIGTWHGSREEQWQPGRSTLLQVLVSIQSMILGTATPADNEPGGLGTSHKEFNKTIQAGTIQAALLPWLRNNELRDGIWKDVVQNHFKTNAADILETAKGWTKGNDRIKKWSPNPYYGHFADQGSPTPEEALNEAAEYVSQHLPPGFSTEGLPSWLNSSGPLTPNPEQGNAAYKATPTTTAWQQLSLLKSPAPTSLESFPPPPPPPQPLSHHYHHPGSPAGGYWNDPNSYAYPPPSPMQTAKNPTLSAASKAKAQTYAAKASSEPPLQPQASTESLKAPPAPVKLTSAQVEEIMNNPLATLDKLDKEKVGTSVITDKATAGGSDTSAESAAGASTSATIGINSLVATAAGITESVFAGGGPAPPVGDHSHNAGHAHAHSHSHSHAHSHSRRDGKRPPKVQTVNLCEELEKALVPYLSASNQA